MRDLWAHKDLGTMVGHVSASVPSHGVAMYRISLPMPQPFFPKEIKARTADLMGDA